MEANNIVYAYLPFNYIDFFVANPAVTPCLLITKLQHGSITSNVSRAGFPIQLKGQNSNIQQGLNVPQINISA
ncbi:hypothetical protein ACX27_08490 [Nostoc piscinale CENA21]|uniref:Uncharacterized protein n=1 Tax=Nostoc piscinale CENA21 TaxID=224013 RepID=A0A0M3V511_9NOSO|nr:hypothetical protein [Nostoc piscinale]ALF52887.1 hypothetical protein ACX27_08490 [Nostoc piscinale CENA21]